MCMLWCVQDFEICSFLDRNKPADCLVDRLSYDLVTLMRIATDNNSTAILPGLEYPLRM